MSKIDVLWLEDEPKKSFKDLAKEPDLNINLILVSTANEAVNYIKKHFDKLDGAILDVRGHRELNDELNDRGMYMVKDELIKRSMNRPIPIAVITGQQDLLLNEKGFEDTLNTKLFRKNRDEEAVLEFIRDGAKEFESVKIKGEHYLAFEIFDEEIVKTLIDEDKIISLKTSLIKQLKGKPDLDSTPRAIRGIYEGLIFPVMKHFGIIPNDCVSFNDMAKNIFIQDEKDIAFLFKTVSSNSQAISHEKGDVKIVTYLQESMDPYYLDCLFKGLLSNLTWLGNYVKSKNGTI